MAGYDISLSSSEANPITFGASQQTAGGGIKPVVLIVLAALALVALVAWLGKGRR